MSKVHNFSAGPCILAPEVIEGAANAVKELDNIGLSLIEISHRSKEFIAIMDEAQSLVREILDVPDNYSVLFLQGGASLGFHMTALGSRGIAIVKHACKRTGFHSGQNPSRINDFTSSANFIRKSFEI